MPDFLRLNKTGLKYLDALTYASIRSFHNSTTDLCYPSYEKIMERSGMSRGCLAASLKRLEASGLLKINHSNREGQCNQYTFGEIERFERIPYELFQAQDLGIYEKAMLLCLRQFFNHGLLQTSYDIGKLAEHLGLSYQQVYKPYKALLAKGYILESIKIGRADKGFKKTYLSSKIDWHYQYEKPQILSVKEVKLMIA